MALYIGQMSGTSLDGLDTVIVELMHGRTPCIRHRSYFPFEHQIVNTLQRLASDSHWRVAEYLSAEHAYSLLSARCIQQLLDGSAISASDIVAIGCHGQTIRHQTAPQIRTHQLMDGALVAEQTGITTICDFRSRDIAAGGQGAPLLPAFLAAAFEQTLDATLCFLNLGGIANICYRHVDGSLRGFDTGPASTLLNQCSRIFFDLSYDNDGDLARAGTIDEELLAALLSDHYFNRLPPKSTGPEHFSLSWLQHHAPNYFNTRDKASSRNLLATLTELSARTVTAQIRDVVPDCRRVVVYGGGVHNLFLMERLRTNLGASGERIIHLQASDELGLDCDMVEAAAFAWLAQQCLDGRAIDGQSVTGSNGPRILGCIYPV